MAPRQSFEKVGWLVPPIALLAILAGTWLALRRPAALSWILLGTLVLVPAGWVLLSALWPASAERRCPACRKDTLVRLDPATAVGLCCSACDWRDESASAWLLAEEEGPLEELVLRQRGRARERRDVDSSAPPG